MDGPTTGADRRTERPGPDEPRLDRGGSLPTVAGGACSRRSLLGSVGATAAIAATAGCLNPVVPDSIEATPYGFAPDVATRRGYSSADHQDHEIDRDVPLADSVSVRSHLVAYGTGPSGPDPIGVLSAPKARVLGDARNPLAGRSAYEILRDPGGSAVVAELLSALDVLPNRFDGWASPPSPTGQGPRATLLDEQTVPRLCLGRAQSHAVLLTAARVETGGDVVLAASGRARPIDSGQSPDDAFSTVAIEAAGNAARKTLPTLEEIDPESDVLPVNSGDGSDSEDGSDEDEGGDDDGLDVCVDSLLDQLEPYVTIICYDEEPNAQEIADWMNQAMNLGGKNALTADDIRDGDTTPAGKTMYVGKSTILRIAIVTPCFDGLEPDTERKQTQGHSPGFTTEAAKQFHRHELGHAVGAYLTWALLRCLDKGRQFPLDSDDDPSFNERLHDRIGEGVNRRRQQDPDPTEDFVEAAAESAVAEIVQEIDGVDREDVEAWLEEVCSEDEEEDD